LALIVHPVQLSTESKPTARPIRMASPVLANGVEVLVEVGGRWQHGFVSQSMGCGSTVPITLTPRTRSATRSVAVHGPNGCESFCRSV
jgi:hypothetical protein